MLRLLYQSFRALLKPALPNKLVQRIFELKIMVINGEYTEDPPLRAGDSARYAWQYVIYAPIEKLYTFLLKEDAFAQFAANVERNKRAYVDKMFSLIGDIADDYITYNYPGRSCLYARSQIPPENRLVQFHLLPHGHLDAFRQRGSVFPGTGADAPWWHFQYPVMQEILRVDIPCFIMLSAYLFYRNFTMKRLGEN